MAEPIRLTGPVPPGLQRRGVLAGGAAVALGLPAARAQTRARVVLQVAAFPLVDEICRAALPAWRQLHPDVDVQVATRQYADHHTAMTTSLSTSVLLPDVMALEGSYVGRFALGSGLEDLRQAPYGIEQFRDRVVPYAYQLAVGRGGAVVAMPTDVGPGTMVYRQDMLAKAGVDVAAMGASWQGFLEAGQRLKANTGAYLVSHARSVNDILLRTGLKPGEGLYFDSGSRVLVDSPRFRRAFEVAREVRRQGLDAKVVTWSNDWAESLRRGRLAVELSGAWMVGQLSNWVAPQTVGLWRAAHLPEGANAGYGGTFYAIPRRANPAHKALAWQFIQLMTLNRERQLAAFKGFDAFPALLETHDDAFFDEPVTFLGGQRARGLWREAARRIAAAPTHKQNNFAGEVVNSELDQVLQRGKDIATALGDAQRLLQRRAHR
ncbi:MAG: ABC transporter substrate-binding protein [Rubrivivax sp.]